MADLLWSRHLNAPSEPDHPLLSRRMTDDSSAPEIEAGSGTGSGMRRRGRHPSPQVRADYLTGNMAPGGALAMTIHFETCTLCNVSIEKRGGRALGEWLARGEAPADDPSQIGE